MNPHKATVANLNIDKFLLLGYEVILPEWNEMTIIAKQYEKRAHVVLLRHKVNECIEFSLKGETLVYREMHASKIGETPFIRIRLHDIENGNGNGLNIFYNTKTREYKLGIECHSTEHTVDYLFVSDDNQLFSIFGNNWGSMKLDVRYRQIHVRVRASFIEMYREPYVKDEDKGKDFSDYKGYVLLNIENIALRKNAEAIIIKREYKEPVMSAWNNTFTCISDEGLIYSTDKDNKVRALHISDLMNREDFCRRYEIPNNLKDMGDWQIKTVKFMEDAKMYKVDVKKMGDNLMIMSSVTELRRT